MDFVEKQHGVARAAQRTRPFDHGANVLDAGQNRRQGDEFGIGATRDQARERGLAGARRSPQNHRVRSCGFQRLAQGRAGTQQMRLADEFIERLRTQPVGERPVAAVARPGHLPSRPITSTPAGGVNENRSGASLVLRLAAEKITRVT